VILKIVPKAGYGIYRVHSEENRPMPRRKAGTEIPMRLLEQSLEASRNLIFIFLFKGTVAPDYIGLKVVWLDRP
jgi:hypothetical protein